MSGTLGRGQILPPPGPHTTILLLPYIPVMPALSGQDLTLQNLGLSSARLTRYNRTEGVRAAAREAGPSGDRVHINFCKAGSAHDQFLKRSPISHTCFGRFSLLISISKALKCPAGKTLG